LAKPKKKPSRIAVYILAFMAFSFSLVGGGLTYFSYDFNNHALIAAGTVVDVEASYNDGSTTYKPTIAYVDFAGEKRVGQTFLSSSSYNFPRGTQVEVLYDTRNPTSLRMNNWLELWGFGFIFLTVGFVLIVIMIFVARATRRKAARIASSSGTASEKTYKYSSNDPRTIESDEDHKRETEYIPTVRRR